MKIQFFTFTVACLLFSFSAEAEVFLTKGSLSRSYTYLSFANSGWHLDATVKSKGTCKIKDMVGGEQINIYKILAFRGEKYSIRLENIQIEKEEGIRRVDWSVSGQEIKVKNVGKSPYEKEVTVNVPEDEINDFFETFIVVEVMGIPSVDYTLVISPIK